MDLQPLLSPLPDGDCLALLQGAAAPLLDWYDQNRRPLPWRLEPTPYRVWISEIMLQQTRVAAVLPYFHRFLEALPDIPSLAAADPELLLKLWEGLGYYSRARNLQACAKVCMQQHGGQLPGDYRALLELPGIGPYTAGAIASIAFGLPVPAVDGNVHRVFARLLSAEGDIAAPAVKKALFDLAAQAVPSDRPGDFNQAIMDLGATVCLPNALPLCASCPLRECCQALARETRHRLPNKAAKKARRVEKKTVVLAITPQGVLLHKRPDSGLLAGLWEFLLLDGHLTAAQRGQALAERGIPAGRARRLGQAKHIFTHVEWRMEGVALSCPPFPPPDGCRFASLKEVRQTYSLPGALRAYTDLLEELL
ncbi:A/G-specific adenine glycosylase [Bittarella massiliensis (ex Durand et al. 2017)]|uniref:Adenine DNA glycosylase n=1 Tax=Bittarella massiliensis (ex Durand et al. 2017) TaxID=1720313 RepID=A0AAW5KBU2_9FIRM|nr:A/G-specific adenine glycosylase [Bittarella massiliensis (ex Durand et al. 2017)]MCQ4948781.1 A/G-specific adenine glycosylase [Bittarella massiliensis (ex Durand et al. 2017)]